MRENAPCSFTQASREPLEVTCTELVGRSTTPLPDPSAIRPSRASWSDLTRLCSADQIPPHRAVAQRSPLLTGEAAPGAVSFQLFSGARGPSRALMLPSGLPLPALGHRRHPRGVAQLSGPLVWLLPESTRVEVRRQGRVPVGPRIRRRADRTGRARAWAPATAAHTATPTTAEGLGKRLQWGAWKDHPMSTMT
jgi:hypothetical protein